MDRDHRLDSDWKRRLRRYGLLVAVLLCCVILSIKAPAFLTLNNWVILLRQISVNGILAVGVTFVLLSGGVDLSLGSVLALAGVVAAHCAHPDQFPLVVPVAVGVLAGAACGGINGAVVTLGRVAPFVVTLGMMAMARGLALVLSGGRPVSNLSREFTSLGAGDFASLAGFGLPIPILILVMVAVVAHLVLQHTKAGRHLYATGGNEKAARAAGIRVNRVKWSAYAACGGLAGLAGVLLASRITTGQPNAGIAYELDAIAAAVIGGTSLSGGVGSVGGTLVGALLLGIISNGLDLLNVSSYYQQIIKGLIIVGAVWLDRWRRSES